MLSWDTTLTRCSGGMEVQHIMTPRRGNVSAMFGFPFETSSKQIDPSASLFEAGPVHSHFRGC